MKLFNKVTVFLMRNCYILLGLLLLAAAHWATSVSVLKVDNYEPHKTVVVYSALLLKAIEHVTFPYSIFTQGFPTSIFTTLWHP